MTNVAVMDRALADSALDLVWPALVKGAADRSVCGTGSLHVVIINPTMPSSAPFPSTILCERSFNRHNWDTDYAWYARKKAELSWRTGLDSHVVLTQFPHLLIQGDVQVWGSVCLDGIVVGVSGAHPWFDEAFATMVAAAVRSLTKARLAAERS